MYLEILDDKRQSLLKKLNAITDLSDFYMAGGTALSLQLKLRDSDDFDFFSPNEFQPSLILDDIKKSGYDYKVLQIARGTLNILVDGIKLQFLQYPYKTIKIIKTEIPGISLASIDDIAAMKFSAIGSRGSKKDFYDLYGIYHTVERYNSNRLISSVMEKYGENANLSYMQMGLIYFDDARLEALPKAYKDYKWADIEQFFINESKRIDEIIIWEH